MHVISPDSLPVQAIFYPGCQLSASSPRQVAKIYEYLRQNVSGGIGLVLGCCGAPAEWAGEQELLDKTMEAFAETWQTDGISQDNHRLFQLLRVFQKPSSGGCRAESLWTLLCHESSCRSPDRKEMPDTVAIHDTCATRYDGIVTG